MDRFTMSVRAVCAAVFVGALSAAGAGCGQNGSGPARMSDADRENAIVHQVSAADIAYAKSEAPVESDSAVLWVNGLGCPLCASNIDRQLVRVKGVRKVNVDLSNGKVGIDFKPGAAHPSPARLGDAVEEAGFTLVRIEKK